MFSGLLEHVSSRSTSPRFIVKGGVALELRLPGKARATDDLDVVAFCDDNDVVRAVHVAMIEPYCDCTFTRRADTLALGDAGTRVWVQVAYRSQRWATIQVDLAKPEMAADAAERVPGIPLVHFGLTGPTHVRCLSIPFHIAQKLHGMTKVPYHGGINDRFRDVVDLLLLRGLVPRRGLRKVRSACEETFRTRGQHAWPTTIAFPTMWREPYASLAASVGVREATLDVAEIAVRDFVRRIAAA